MTAAQAPPKSILSVLDSFFVSGICRTPILSTTTAIGAVMQRIKNSTASLTGITLYMQPVQDLTIEGTVSRTQYQFILQDADAAQLAEWTPKLIDKLRQLPQLADVASDISNNGLSVFVEIDRDQAARFGITPA